MHLGTAVAINVHYVSTANGSLTKSTTVVRVISASRWESKLVLGARGIPGKHNPSGAEVVDTSIEYFQDTRLHADEEV